MKLHLTRYLRGTVLLHRVQTLDVTSTPDLREKVCPDFLKSNLPPGSRHGESSAASQTEAPTGPLRVEGGDGGAALQVGFTACFMSVRFAAGA